MERISFVSFVSLQGGEVGSFPGPGKAKFSPDSLGLAGVSPSLGGRRGFGRFPRRLQELGGRS